VNRGTASNAIRSEKGVMVNQKLSTTRPLLHRDFHQDGLLERKKFVMFEWMTTSRSRERWESDVCILAAYE
jgi:hypothetical protein